MTEERGCHRRTERLLLAKSNAMDSSSPQRHLGATLVSDTTSQRNGGVTMKFSRIGIDLAKNVFQIHGVDGHGEQEDARPFFPVLFLPHRVNRPDHVTFLPVRFP